MLCADSAGYNRVLYRPELKKVARAVARKLARLIDKTGADAVVVTGKSGIAMGFAAAMFADIPLVTLRKQGDSTHGLRIEGPHILVTRYIILDDFIDSGATVERIDNEIAEYAECVNRGTPPICVGIIEYLHSAYGYKDWDLPRSGKVTVYNLKRQADWNDVPTINRRQS